MRRVLADNRDFRLLWLSQAGSGVGDSLVLVVLALYVNDIGSPTDVGLVLAAHGIPFAALLLIGGVWADRLPRHRVMVSTDLARAALHGLLAVLVVTAAAVPIWAIAAVEALFGAAEAFWRPAYTGLVPQTVPDADIARAQAVIKVTENVAEFAGPAAGSALFLTLGAAAAFAVDAVTFVVSALILVRVRPRERAAPAVREPLRAELAGGFHELRSRPWAGLIVAGASVSVLLLLAPFEALGPAAAHAGYGEAAIYGALAACLGVGALGGAVLAIRRRPRRPALAWLLWAPFSLLVAVFALEAPVVLLVLAALGTGVGIGVLDVWWETSLALSIPPAALSRVSAWDWMGSLALLPFGFLLVGPISEAIGVQATLLLGAGAAFAVQLTIAAALAQEKSGTPVSVVDASA